MATLAVFQPDVRVAARIGAALGGAHVVDVRASWSELRSLLVEGAFEGCIVDADHPTREIARREIIGLRGTYPNLAIVAYADLSGEMEYFDLGGVGVDRIVRAEDQDAASMRSIVDQAMVVARSARVERALEPRYGRFGARAVRWAMEHARSRVGVEEFALALGHTARSLAPALADARLPTPSRLLVWGRLLVAGSMLDRDGRTIEETAYSLGYSSANALSRAMKKHTDFTPGQVAGRGGMVAVHGALFGQLGRASRALRALGTWLLPALILGASGCAGSGGGGASVDRQAIHAVLETSPMDQLHFGIHAVDARTGRVVYSQNAKRKFIPASNQKILTTSTALSRLGPDYRYRTEVRTRGAVRDGTVHGDLEVMATGDPSLSDRYWDSGEQALSAMADSIRAHGVHTVTGSLVVDVARWDSTSVGPTWEVEDLRYGYGSTGGAFALDEGEVQVVVSAGPDVDTPATVSWSPFGTSDFVRSRLVTAPADSTTRVRPHYLPESRFLRLDGQVPLGAVDTLSFAMRDPVRQAAAALHRTITSAGIHTEQGLRIRWEAPTSATGACGAASNGMCDRTDVLFALQSPPMAELAAGILEPSQNWMTEQVVRTLGAELGESGSWSGGMDVVRDFLVHEVGVDSFDVAPRDGSGLSAYNLVTPRALVSTLQHMQNGPWAAEYRAALAEPGEEGSTLSRRLEGLEGRVFAKTGTISNVNSLSGYLVRDDGSELVFSILSNGSGLPASRVRAAIDDVLRILAR